MLLVIAILILVFALVVVTSSIKVVPADHAYVVERLGRYLRTASPGVQVLAPFVDGIRFRFSLLPTDERLTDDCITLDNVPVTITSTFRWQVVEPEKAAYAAADVTGYVRGVVQSAQRRCISERPWKDLRESTREIQACVLRAVAEPAVQGGVKVVAHDVGTIERVR